MSKVSRAVYQKLKEENKRLLKDLELITKNEFCDEKLMCIVKWRKHFSGQRQFEDFLKSTASNFIENNPNDPAVKFVKSLKTKEK